MTPDSAAVRSASFGEGYELSPVDRLGTWLSLRAVTRRTGSLKGLRYADVGCGFDARLARVLCEQAEATTVVDVSISESVRSHPGITSIEGPLPQVMAKIDDAAFDVLTCISVLEHVWEDLETLTEFRRVLAPGATLVLNVPSWWGKAALEFSAFRLRLSPASEMNDHKRYYDPRDLWPLLVRAGFVPQHIACHRHKFGLNTLAVCVVPRDDHDERERT